MEECKGDGTNPAGFSVGRGWGDREGRWRNGRVMGLTLPDFPLEEGGVIGSVGGGMEG